MKQKIKVMKHKPELSDEEIRSYMDFDRLMASKKLVTGTQDLSWVLKRIVPVIAITALVTWVVFNTLHNNDQVVPETLKQDKTEVLQPAEIQIPATTEQTPTEEDKLKQETVTSEKAPVNTVRKQESEPSKTVDTHVGENIYVQAEPSIGYPALYSYFSTQLVYPHESIKDSIQGVQTVTFIINASGVPEKIEVKQSLGEPFEREAKRLIENMPSWKPATLNGKPVSSQISLPLTFQIQNIRVKD